MDIETLIFSNLIDNESYCRKVIPFIEKEYFQQHNQQVLYSIIKNYIEEYNRIPSKEAIIVELRNYDQISDEQYSEIKQDVKDLPGQSNDDETWLLNKTEEFCKHQAVYNAILESIKIIDDKTGKTTTGAIPDLLSQALSVSFDNSVGHDFIDDMESRYDFYHRKEERIPFDIAYLNKITRGGLPRKTLNILLAPTGVGKTLVMCHMAASNVIQGRNVLYITMEMAEEKIAERIDANLLDVSINDLYEVPKDTYIKKINRLKDKTVGKLIIKEYPTSSAGSANFRHLLDELAVKKNFVPDIVYIDYLNICISSRLKNAVNVNSYSYVKTIAEELRGLAVEFNLPIVSATQTNRAGFDNSDIDLTDTSESIGLPATADFMLALIANEELIKADQMMMKQLKNRYNDPNKYKRFLVGVDRPKMRLYNLESDAQTLSDSGIPEDDEPVFDNTLVGQKFNTSFEDFK